MATAPMHMDGDSVAAAIDAAGAAASAPATTAAFGTVKKMPAQVDSVAADVATLKTDFNSLLAKLRTAGILT